MFCLWRFYDLPLQVMDIRGTWDSNPLNGSATGAAAISSLLQPLSVLRDIPILQILTIASNSVLVIRVRLMPPELVLLRSLRTLNNGPPHQELSNISVLEKSPTTTNKYA